MGRHRWRWTAVLLAVLLLSGCFNYNSRGANPYFSFDAPTQETVGKATQQNPLKFPMVLPDSGLIAEEIISYSGAYWEDGSGEWVDDIFGLMLYNPSERMVDFAAISMDSKAGKLYFFVYRLPPQSRCLVLEKSRNAYRTDEPTDCRELSIRWEYPNLSREQLDYLGLGNRLTVINRDARQQNHVTIWYKHYNQNEDYYLGGVSYSTHVFFLQPEERRTIMPEHYEAGKVKVVHISSEA